MANSDLNSALGLARTTSSELGIAGLPERATNRYLDSYRTAKSIIRIARIVKLVGITVGVLVILVGFFAASNSGGSAADTAIISGLLTGGGIILAAFIAGVMISAQGYQLLAALDSAVHTSPFLDNETKARAMDL